jgi:hypothetical protein
MKTRLAVALLAVGLVLGGYFWATRKPEPSYHGRSWSQWLDVLTSPIAEGHPSRNAAERAFQAMGKPVAPFPLETFLREPGIWRSYRWAYDRLPYWIVQRLPRPYSLLERKASAGLALTYLGTNAVEVLPSIMAATNERVLNVSASILGACAPGTPFESNAVEHLVRLSQDAMGSRRAMAFRAMPRFANPLDRFIAPLVSGLTVLDGSNDYATLTLEEIGRRAVPSLIEAAGTERGKRRPALSVLEKIDPEAAAQVKAAQLSSEQNPRTGDRQTPGQRTCTPRLLAAGYAP